MPNKTINLLRTQPLKQISELDLYPAVATYAESMDIFYQLNLLLRVKSLLLLVVGEALRRLAR